MCCHGASKQYSHLITKRRTVRLSKTASSTQPQVRFHGPSSRLMVTTPRMLGNRDTCRALPSTQLTVWAMSLLMGHQMRRQSASSAFSMTIYHLLLPFQTTVRRLLKYKFWNEEPLEREFSIHPWSPSSDIAQHVDRLATVITNNMRQSSSDAITGKAFSQETYVEVRWVWLILPLALLGLTLIFLLGTVIRTSIESDRVGVWKNSAIATLLYGLPDEMQHKISTSQGNGTPRAKAKEMNVRMLSTKKWRISGHILSPTVRKSKPPPGWI